MAGGKHIHVNSITNMNTKEQADQLRLAADILETGHPWESMSSTAEWGIHKISPLDALSWGHKIRPILATPPDGRPLHNPDKLTAEQVGVGKRLTAKGDHFSYEAEVWNSARNEWRKTSADFFDLAYTYRLPLSVPWPEPEPEFQLPTPPPGIEWHDSGWTADMLPRGFRPLHVGEQICKDDEYFAWNEGPWKRAQDGPTGDKSGNHIEGNDVKYRTTRPLEFEHLGKTWTWHKAGDPMPCDGEACVDLLLKDGSSGAVKTEAKKLVWGTSPLECWHIIGWRYAEPATIGPEDVQPFSVIRRKDEKRSWHWRLLSYVHGTHAICAGRGYTWSELARDYEINRSVPLTGKWNPDAWEPCSKEVAV